MLALEEERRQQEGGSIFKIHAGSTGGHSWSSGGGAWGQWGQRRGLRREGIVPKRKTQRGMGGNRRFRAGSPCHFWEACWHSGISL